MSPGTGTSSGACMSATGALTRHGAELQRLRPCSRRTRRSRRRRQAGLFGNPVNLTLRAALVQVPSSVIVGVQTAQTGGEGDAVLERGGRGKEAEKDKEQSADEARTQGGAEE